MSRYILRRLLLMIPAVFAVVTVVFVVLHVAGGDPATAVLGDDVDVEVKQAFREKYGLNRPLTVQYVSYLNDLAHGDLGVSYMSGRPVFDAYMEMLPPTVELVAGAILLALLIGIPLGILGAIKHDTIIDYLTTAFSTTMLGFPIFFLGIVLLLVFGVRLRLFPILGAGDRHNVADTLWHLVLPAFSLALVEGSRVLRVTRTSIISLFKEDYVRTARAKGLSEATVIYRHVLRNALIPIAVLIGLQVAHLLAGAILTETVFNRPGIGRLLVGAIHARDYPLVQSGLLIMGVMTVVVNLIADLSIGFIDPRVRYE